jgi:hypothetical protein
LLAPEFQLARAAPIVQGLGKLLPRAVPRLTRATQPAATIGERLNRAATTGGIYGGISGVGNAQADNPQDALLGGGIGAATGAVLGPAVSGAVSGLGAGARWAADRARSVLGPEGQAQRLVTRALEQDRVGRDLAAGLPPKADEAVQEAQQRLGTALDQGQPAIIADVGDTATRSLARTAANVSPVSRQAVENVTEPRFNQQGTRVAGFIQNLTGAGGDTTATREAVQAAARRANRPAYARAYAEGEAGVWTSELEGLTAAPAVQDAVRGAVKTGANRAAAEGFRPPRNPFIQAEDGTLQLAPGVRPTLQFWDHVKRNLDGAIGVAQRAGDNTKAGELQDLRTALLQQLDAAAPSYRGARQGAAGYFGMDDALDVGRNLARGIKMEYPDIARGLAGMNEAERRLAREGYVNSVMDQLTDIRDRRDVVNALPAFSTEKGRRVANMILGADNAARLEDFIHVENIMNRTRQEVSGNSTTARQQFLQRSLGVTTEGTLAGGAALYAGQGDLSDPKTYLAPLLVMGARRAGQYFDRRVMEQVGRLLASDDPQQLNQGLRIVARNQGVRQALNYVDQMLQRPAVTNPAAQQGLQQ